MTTQVDFYLIADNSKLNAELATCRIAEKAYLSDTPVVISTRNDAHSAELDALLWSFRDTSFIPHKISSDPHAAPVVLGSDPDKLGSSPAAPYLVINLREKPIENLTNISRVIEIVACNETAKAAARQHYRHYQHAGCQLNTHNI